MYRSAVPVLFCVCSLIPAHAALAQRDYDRARETVFQEAFAVGAGGTLDLNVEDADIEIRTGAVADVTVEVGIWSRDMDWARDEFDRMEFRADRNGNTVRVSAREPRRSGRSWSRNRWVSVDVVVTVPQRFNVQVETVDGDISVDDIQGSLDLYTVDGDVTLGDVTGDVVDLRTTDGDVVARTIVARRVIIESSDGDLRLGPVSGDVTVETSDGDIDIEFGAVQGVTLGTSDGDISIYAPRGFGAEIYLQGEDLSVPRGVVGVGRMSRRSIRGVLNGGGPRVEARTSDGEIVFRTAR